MNMKKGIVSSFSLVVKKRKNELFCCCCFKHMTDEYVYTMRINMIVKKMKKKGQSIRSKPVLFFFVDKECFCTDLFGLKSSLNKAKHPINDYY
jgi:hypothetical protein